MSEPSSDFTNEPPHSDQDITAQPVRPAYDYGPYSDEDHESPIRRLSKFPSGWVIVALLAGFSAFVIFALVVCSR